MAKSMGKSKIGYRNELVPEYYSYNPGGWGCTAGCDGCWARAMTKRLGETACPHCKAFIPHMHAERMDQPIDTKKPGVVLVNFTCDTWDKARNQCELHGMQHAALVARRHNYVWLTKNPPAEDQWDCGAELNHWLGLSLCNQEQADAKLPTFLQIPGQLWLSLEPLWESVDLSAAIGEYNCMQCGYRGDDCGEDRCTKCECHYTPNQDGNGEACPKCGCTDYELSCPQCGRYDPFGLSTSDPDCNHIAGVIIGQDNRRNSPGTDTLDHVRSVVKQCKAAGVPVFVKQLFMEQCQTCSLTWPPGTRNEAEFCPECGHGHKLWTKLFHDPLAFPEDLRHRDLPWGMP